MKNMWIWSYVRGNSDMGLQGQEEQGTGRGVPKQSGFRFNRVVRNEQVTLKWLDWWGSEPRGSWWKDQKEVQVQRPRGQSLPGVPADQQSPQPGWAACWKWRVVGGEVGEDWIVHFVSHQKGFNSLKLRQETVRKLTTKESMIWVSVNTNSRAVVLSKGQGREKGQALLLHESCWPVMLACLRVVEVQVVWRRWNTEHSALSPVLTNIYMSRRKSAQLTGSQDLKEAISYIRRLNDRTGIQD